MIQANPFFTFYSAPRKLCVTMKSSSKIRCRREDCRCRFSAASFFLLQLSDDIKLFPLGSVHILRDFNPHPPPVMPFQGLFLRIS